MTTRWLALLFACLTLGIVAVGCGGDDDDNGDGGSADTTEEQPAPAAEGGEAEGGGAGGGTEVSMKDIKFDPATVTIKAGDTVTWVNDDSVGHDVTGDDFESGGPGEMQNGDTFDHTFEKAGTFDYVCTVHPGMKGTVKVE
jgi:plastocyanin